MYICQSQSPNSSHTPLPPWYPYVCSLRLCLYFRFVNKIVSTNFFRFHIYVLIYDICFSLSGLLHSVWQSLGPSMSLQMTQFCSFLWLSNIPLYMCTTSSLSIPLLMDAFAQQRKLNKMKRQPSEWEKIFAKEATDKGLISKIHKQLMQLSIRKNKQNQKMGRRPK